jgi:hypothetical protein
VAREWENVFRVSLHPTHNETSDKERKILDKETSEGRYMG